MRTTVAVAVMSIIVSILSLAVTDNIDARTRGSDSGAIESPSGSGFNTTVCGPDSVHLCQTSDGQ
jgi:hypothetical protein